MTRISSTIIVLIVLSLVSLSACGSDGTTDSSSETITNQGGEELLGVHAEYSFCYDTGAYDPTQRYTCELPLTYKECRKWKAQQEGTGKTVFYANFTGGDPTISGRTANIYYMVVNYSDGKIVKTDTQAAFKDIPAEFMAFVDDDCYPNATIEIYNTNDDLMGSMSLDYSQE
ncbi:MAG: hypothetical protein ACQESE_02540 [Nanobdellota archaeon]